MSGAAAVFLDRDGVLNRALVRGGRPYSPRNLDELELLPGVEDACRRLRAAGFLLLVATNQPDVARRAISRETVDAMNESVRSRLSLDAVLVCPHDDADGCSCRKPQPGLITGACERFGVDPHISYLVGDRWRDIEAGRRAGCRTVLLEYGYDEPSPEPDARASSLSEAAGWILSDSSR